MVRGKPHKDGWNPPRDLQPKKASTVKKGDTGLSRVLGKITKKLIQKGRIQ